MAHGVIHEANPEGQTARCQCGWRSDPAAEADIEAQVRAHILEVEPEALVEPAAAEEPSDEDLVNLAESDPEPEPEAEKPARGRRAHAEPEAAAEPETATEGEPETAE